MRNDFSNNIFLVCMAEKAEYLVTRMMKKDWWFCTLVLTVITLDINGSQTNADIWNKLQT